MPSGNTYEIKDLWVRETKIPQLEQLIAGGVSFVTAWNGTSTPVVANIPEGVVVIYNNTNYTGTLSADDATPGSFYLVKSSTQEDNLDVYDEYVVVTSGNTKAWEKIGDTQLDLSDLGALAYKDSVTLNKQTATVLTGVKASSTDKVLGADTTFTVTQPTITVTPSSTSIKATASGTTVGANGTAAAITGFGTHTTETFVKSVSAETGNKLVTTTVPNVTGNTSVSIPNVTNVGSASTWSFAMGNGNDSETLIISGANGTAPTLGTALSASKVTLGEEKTVATGSVSSSGTGSAIVTGVTVGESASAITALGAPTTSNCLTGVEVTAQPTISIGTGTGTGSYSVVTGITSATATNAAVSANNDDEVTAILGVTSDGTATVLTNSTDVTVS